MPDGMKSTVEPSGGNLRLWNRLKMTDPSATKAFTRGGGFRGTQINPTWRVQQMTEHFGPVGVGWGYEQLECKLFTPDHSPTDAMVFICVRVWYIDPTTKEKAWTGPQWGGTELYRKRRDGTAEPNDEAFKMSMTDALGKCFVQIGLAADIHLGLWDDSKYRDEAEAAYALKDREDLQPAELDKRETAILSIVDIATAVDDLNKAWNSNKDWLVDVRKVDAARHQRISTKFSEKKAEILRAQTHPTTQPARVDKPAIDESARARLAGFFEGEHYTIPVPKMKGGKGYNWPEFDRLMRTAAAYAPSADAIMKLREDNVTHLEGYCGMDKAKHDELLRYMGAAEMQHVGQEPKKAEKPVAALIGDEIPY